MEIIVLGTSSMVPTKERNPSSIFLSYKGEGILFDCAEGTQRQMAMVGLKRNKARKILISHWHGDHVAGLIGLLQTIGHEDKTAKIDIYGPVGSKEHMKHVVKMCYFDVKIEITVHELNPKKVETFLETEDYDLQCISLDHAIPCLAFAFVEKDKRNIDIGYLKKNKIRDGPHLEKLRQGKDVLFEGKKISFKEATYLVKGKKIAYVMDTAYTKNAILIAKNADILFSESTYGSKHQDKAEDYKHMSAKDAAQLASQAEVKQLILSHFSQRYKDVSELLEEAQAIFPNTKAAYDLMKIDL